MRKLAFFALAVVAVGCSTEAEQASGTAAMPGVADPGVSPAQVRAFEQLQLATSPSWTWMQNAKLKTPMHLSAPRTGKPMLGASAHAETVTLGFVDQYKDLFRVRDAAAELKLEKTEVDDLKMTHVRFQQVTHGVPVVGAELAAHYDAAGRIASVDASYVADLEGLDLEPKISARAGSDIALADAIASSSVADESHVTATEGKLVVFALGDLPATLAYEYTVRAVEGEHPAIWVTTVDARTGQIIDRYNNLQTVEATGLGVNGTAQKFQVTAAGAGYQMLDTSRGVQIRTYNAGNLERGPAQGAPLVASTSLTSWDTGVGRGAAVDAHANASMVFDYYKKVHGRNALDGAGGALVSTVHFGQAYDNAFWDPTTSTMSYGDGGQIFKPLSAGLDVVAHEFTHGVISSTSNLRYQGQSGALNEAVADIFGSFIEHANKPDPVKNWLCGEDIAKAGGGLRDFKNPAAFDQPANMKNFVNTQQDAGGVHINSGIINNAALLMTVGGINPVSKTEVKFGIGWEKAEKLWYRANSKYFLVTTSFAQGAQGVMQAAKDIGLTENETNIVDCAWKATGVVQGACAAITDPKAVNPPTAPGGADPADETGTGGTPTSSTDETPEDQEDEETSGTTPKKKPRSTLAAQPSAGCSVSAHGDGGTDLGPVAGLLAAVLGLALGRRKRK